jgi:CheY-like chemotaxis protein
MLKPIRCILLIDDDPDDTFLHQMVIDSSGLCDTVQVAENGVMALNYLSNPDAPAYVRPDIILLDINMPAMNGFEFLERYTKLDAHLKSRQALLMLTTSLNPTDTHRASLSKEVKGYYAKPLTKDIIQRIVNTFFIK